MTAIAIRRSKIRADFNAACENAAAAYDRGDSVSLAFWSDQRDRFERLLNKLS